MSDHMREQFEDTMSSQGEWPQAIEKDLAGGYKLAITATAWETWQPAWEAGQEMMKSRIKELEAINLGLTKTLVEMEAEKARLVGALGKIDAMPHYDYPLRYGCKKSLHDRYELMLQTASEALAAYRKQGGSTCS